MSTGRHFWIWWIFASTGSSDPGSCDCSGPDVTVTETAPRYRLGVDVGGTFTDFALFDENSSEIAVLKRLTTPAP